MTSILLYYIINFMHFVQGTRENLRKHERNLIDPLKQNGNSVSHLLQQSVNCSFCIYEFRMILTVNSDYILKQR
jgi:hypothetical protein